MGLSPNTGANICQHENVCKYRGKYLPKWDSLQIHYTGVKIRTMGLSVNTGGKYLAKSTNIGETVQQKLVKNNHNC